jgi:cytochrome c-type biogenesis protein CcmH
MSVRTFCLALSLALPLFVLQPEAQAEEPAVEQVESIGIPDVLPGPVPSEEEVDVLTQKISAGLRCPVCQGLSVADSTSAAAVQMQHRIRELVALGYSRQAIEDYFTSKYGEWVLLDPTSSGLNRIIWIGPLLAALLGLIAAMTFLQASEEEEPLPPLDLNDDPYASSLLAEVDDD